MNSQLLHGRSSEGPLRIGINAQLEAGNLGGVEQALIGLAGGLSELSGDEEYYFLTLPGQSNWLQPFIGGNCKIIESKAPRRKITGASRIRSIASQVAPRTYSRLREAVVTNRQPIQLPESDGSLEELDVRVIHFPVQSLGMFAVGRT